MNELRPEMTPDGPSAPDALSGRSVIAPAPPSVPLSDPVVAHADEAPGSAEPDNSASSVAEPVDEHAEASPRAEGGDGKEEDGDRGARTVRDNDDGGGDGDGSDDGDDGDDEEELPLPPETLHPGPASVQWAEDSDAARPDSSAGTSEDRSGEKEPDEEDPAQADGGGDDNGGGEPPLPPATTGGASVPANPDGEKDEKRDDVTPEDDEPMTLLGHLGELRRRLTRVIIAIILGFFACYSVAEPTYNWLLIPLKASLPETGKLIYTSPQGLFFVYMKLALLASVFVTSPFAFYQLWAFIAPGLYREEKRAILPLSLLSALFFLSGATFCYFMVFPVAFQFFMGFATELIVPMISVEEYLSFVLKLLIAFGLVFEMPLFSYFLSKMGLLTPEAMRRHRKYAILSIFIVAAVLTPPDVFSQCLMAAPMLVLYEISVYVSAMARKGRDKAKASTEGEAGAESETDPEDA